MSKYMPAPMLKHYVTRYRKDTELLEKHKDNPENKALLKRRIKRHEQDIIAYVTSDNFQCVLNSFNL